ncbi:DNA polymerase delta small subunit [Metarhizium album ARSEF 1941]|uniref:DNA-directed DNA polymerase n=1 Tax=Metarhizium album (strain ARSEF 1941) TaxID=1081103 RepID=A0A0B2WYH9_METAS|nr:DNA polymerase delta small subunit [Metarhizium album ARSEF 1941]KHN98482.1 DNA polymerase delta small subunit [Metarhizium album ARSEF 1941]
MVTLEEVSHLIPKSASDAATPTLSRAADSYKPLHAFDLDKRRPYKQQYGDMYFLRLTKIKPAVEEAASASWEGTVIGGEEVKRVERVLDVRQGELCWVAGTVYMDMPLKPSILEDVSKDRWISAPIPTQQTYFSPDGSDQVMLEDDSGRIRLVGDVVHSVPLVTGCIIAVMGTENSSGEFEVIDTKFPDLADQPERWALSKPLPPSANGLGKGRPIIRDEHRDVEMTDASPPAPGKKMAIVSGLSFSSTGASHAVELNLLQEYLLGQALAPADQEEVASISRLIIAGNSISAAATEHRPDETEKKGGRKYGYDASSYNALPSQLLDDFLDALLPSIPVTLVPGAQDPANASYPQQPVHMALFPRARAYGPEPAKPKEPGWFDAVTNPWEAELEGWRVLGTGGQNVDDVFKYVDSDDRLGMMEAMCRWRCCAPTAPDTLWSYPFQEDDPFVMKTCPHLFFVGCQPEFSTRTIGGPRGQSVRLITVPSFAETKELVLVDMETMEVSLVSFGKQKSAS